MSKAISVGFAEMQIVLKAKCLAFCRCGKGDDTSCEGAVCDCTRAFSIPPECLKQVQGNFFVQLSRSNNSIRRMICCLALSTERTTDDTIFQVLGKTSIIDDLVKEREIALRVQATNCSRAKAESFKKRWHRNKKFAGKLATVPDVITVMAPQVGDVASCELRMLSSSINSKGPKSVVIEINDQSLTWLASAIDWQYRHGNVESGYVQAREKKRRKLDADEESESSSSDSGSSEPSGGRDDAKQVENAHGEVEANIDAVPAVDQAQDAAASVELAPEAPAVVGPPVVQAAPKPAPSPAATGPPPRQLTLSAMFARK